MPHNTPPTRKNQKGNLKVKYWQKRSKLISLVHNFFLTRNFCLLDTPILVQTPGIEVHMDYFATSWVDYQDKEHPLFLRSSPELHLKKALSEGLTKVYEVAKCFRNAGEISPWHHPEFTMIEWYEEGISFTKFMDQTEDLVRYLATEMHETYSTPFKLPPQIKRISVYEAFSHTLGIELIDNDPNLAKKAINRDPNLISLNKNDDFETAFFKIMLDKVEPYLKELGIVFLYDYPPSQAILSKVEEGRARRFELYIDGIEICNAFYELTNFEENYNRIESARETRKTLNKQETFKDDDFYNALKSGLKESCGNALGLDRLLTIILGEENLSTAIPFRNNLPFRNNKNISTS